MICYEHELFVYKFHRVIYAISLKKIKMYMSLYRLYWKMSHMYISSIRSVFLDLPRLRSLLFQIYKYIRFTFSPFTEIINIPKQNIDKPNIVFISIIRYDSNPTSFWISMFIKCLVTSLLHWSADLSLHCIYKRTVIKVYFLFKTLFKPQKIFKFIVSFI